MMFGYTVPSYDRLSASDLRSYRDCYCESCHQLKKHFGLVSTLAVNYDMTFNAIILNSMSDDGIKEQNKDVRNICVLGKTTEDTETLKRAAAYTILLTKWELVDDKNDGPSLKSNTASLVLNRAIKKAEKMYPEYDRFLDDGFSELRQMEEDEYTDAVKVGRTFSKSIILALEDISGNLWNTDLEKLFTSLGTSIYVMDAVDDLDEDYMNGTYNPFLASDQKFVNKKTYIDDNVYDIGEMFNEIMMKMQTSYINIRPQMQFHTGVSDNVIFYGLPNAVKQIMMCDRTSELSIKNMIENRKKRNNRM